MKMKAILKLLLVALFAASMLLMVSCSHSSCFVNFDADGGSTVDSGKVIQDGGTGNVQQILDGSRHAHTQNAEHHFPA